MNTSLFNAIASLIISVIIIYMGVNPLYVVMVVSYFCLFELFDIRKETKK